MSNEKPDYLRFMSVGERIFSYKYVEGVGDYLSRIQPDSRKITVVGELMSAVDLFIKRGEIVSAYKKFLAFHNSIPHSERRARSFSRKMIDEVRRCVRGAGISLEEMATH